MQQFHRGCCCSEPFSPLSRTLVSHDAHCAPMIDEGAKKKALLQDETTYLVLHHDGLSRAFASMKLPHLSTRHSSDFRAALDGKRKYKGRPRASDDPFHSVERESLGYLPHWYEIHNQTCARCDNPLLLSFSCTAIEKSGRIQCTTCRTVQERGEPSREVKRLYRSVRTRLSSKKEQRVVKAVEEGGTAIVQGHKMDVDEVVSERILRESPPKDIKDPKTLLQQRAAELKRKSKEQRKQGGARLQDVVETKQVDLLAQGQSALSSKRKQPPVASAKQDENLRQMLAKKRAKEQPSPLQRAGATSGLQDFLGSL